jgi:hypothetical protein
MTFSVLQFEEFCTIVFSGEFNLGKYRASFTSVLLEYK